MTDNQRQFGIRHSQTGMVAIVVTVVFMLVISLMLLGFAKVVQREQRQSLDRHLSTRAYYAAESGVNLASKVVRDAVQSGAPTLPEKTNCDPAAAPLDAAGLQLDGTNTVISCLLIDPYPRSLDYTNIDTFSSQVVPVMSADNLNIGDIDISWQPSGPAQANFGACPVAPPSFSTQANWSCSLPVLRVDIVPIPRAGLVNSGTIADQTFTSFLYPVSCTGVCGIANTNIGAGTGISQGLITQTNCRTGAPTPPLRPLQCVARIDVSGLLPTQNDFYVRIMSIYNAADVVIFARENLTSSRLRLRDAQVVIDSTGRSVDILRRVQVRLSLSGSNSSSQSSVTTPADFAIQSVMGLCKRYLVSPGTLTFSAATDPECSF